MKIFGQRMREEREKQGMSQDDLAKVIGTSKQVLSRYETGQRTPRVDMALMIATALHVELTALLN